MNYQERISDLLGFLGLYVEMRAAQNAYFHQRKLEGTRFPSKEARHLLKKSKNLEATLDNCAILLTAPSPRSCDRACGPGDFREGGVCHLMGCYPGSQQGKEAPPLTL